MLVNGASNQKSDCDYFSFRPHPEVCQLERHLEEGVGTNTTCLHEALSVGVVHQEV